MGGEGGGDGGPEGVVVGRGVVRRIDRGEAGVAALDDEPVQRAGEAERQRVGAAARVARPAEHPVGDRVAGREAVGDAGGRAGR